MRHLAMISSKGVNLPISELIAPVSHLSLIRYAGIKARLSSSSLVEIDAEFEAKDK